MKPDDVYDQEEYLFSDGSGDETQNAGDGNRKAQPLVRPDLAKDFNLRGLAMSWLDIL